MDLQIPDVYSPLWTKEARYYFLRGGRGSGKSWAVADKLLITLVQNSDLNLVCLREVQKSIKHSSKKLLSDRITALGLNDYFDVLLTEIRLKKGRGIIIFNGLQDHTVDSIKSLEGFDLCWVEEAQTITSHSLELLIPTIRAENSKILFTYNPKHESDAIETLRDEKQNKIVIHSTYLDNSFSPSSIIEEAEEMKEKRPLKYNHIYMGHYGQSEGLIFENVETRIIREEEIKGLECVQGLDFGYTNDPTAFCINYIDNENKIFYVFDGFYKKRLLNNQIADEIKTLNAHKHKIFADSAEPKSIDTLKYDGISRITGAIKGKDSINAGIDFLLDYHIIINAHLKDFIEEANNYTWSIDKNTNKPTNKPIDDNNHFWDACFSEDTKVIVNNNVMQFKDIPNEGMIRGFNGKNVPYVNGGFIRYDKIYNIKLKGGIIIKATADHEFLTINGWVKAIDLKGKQLCKSNIFQNQNVNLIKKDIINIKGRSISVKGVLGFIEQFGNFIMELYQKVFIYTTTTTIQQTIVLKISEWKHQKNISQNTGESGVKKIQKKQCNRWKAIKTNAGLGIKVKMEEYGIKNTMKKCVINYVNELKKNVNNVVKHIMGSKESNTLFAQTNVNLNGEENLGLMMSKDDVSSAIKILQQTSIIRQSVVVENVELFSEKEKTYCVTVPINECFSLENNLIVSNCRYSISDKIIRPSSTFSTRINI